jgi:glycine C-acetyltransferase
MRSVVVRGATAIVDGKRAIHLCSNDYLGLSKDPRLVRKTSEALHEISQCSSRLIAGNSPAILKLEKMLATHRGTDAALVFPTGYMANLGAVTAIADANTTILSDELNHASLIDACRLSGASIKVFRHNDAEHVERLLRKASGRTVVITEGIFSMDGDLANLREICKIARENDAMTILDDAHGDFIFGEGFSGVPSFLGEAVDIHVSSLSKALGCFGGYVASSKNVIELMINASKQFIYTSALPGHLCVAASEALKLVKDGRRQARLFQNINFLRGELSELGFELGISKSQIIPIVIGREDVAVEFSKQLLDAGVFAQAVRYPTVKKGSARLRISLTAMHTAGQLREAVTALRRIGRINGVIG